MYENPSYPPTIIYGSEVPDLRLRSRGGTQIYFCRRNRNLHLTDADFRHGTYEAGTFLSALCAEFCRPTRGFANQGASERPCPAFVEDFKVFTHDDSLASVEARKTVDLSRCVGVQKLLEVTETPEERFLLSAYLKERSTDESPWRSEVIEHWNTYCSHVEDDSLGIDKGPRRNRFDQLMWATLRFPALIPQVWLNWLASTSEEHLRALDENPSRVDFIAFYRGHRHMIEVDGPSHYASYNERSHTYSVDERAYARNLRIARSLERQGWLLTRIGRIEVKDAMEGGNDDDFLAPILARLKLISILRFPDRLHYPSRPSYGDLGLDEIQAKLQADFEDIPF